ncbi:TolB-like translocation protein [Pedobacter jamesrossensis]|uniref:WD40-like Beta Propeller Repeat n=1 Tax=Pedobacter jamesrossensis TaxID=1908238 RepID=A0ABV8NG51_9SPHI
MNINNINKKLFIRHLTILTLSFISSSVFGQIFSTAQNPLSVKWNYIQSGGFKIIYPKELEKDAQRMANTLPFIYPKIGLSLRQQNTSIPLLLQNRGTIANGFVQLAPKKSEFYATPPQYFDSQDWLNNLAVHELRHIAQFDKLTGIQTHPFPELVYFAYFGAGIPTWFFEGDAVVNETALTESGRGRQPKWIMPFRTSLLEGKKFSYSKAYFGSNKDITPGYYQTGYLMVADMKEKFGQFISDSLLGDIRKRPVRLYPFSQSLKKYTGKNTKDYFLSTQEKLTKNWNAQQEKLSPENYESLNQKTWLVTNYFLPVRLNKNQILALKESKQDARHFVIVNEDKTEQRLFGIGYQEQPWFSSKKDLIVWDEIRYDPRYKQRSYSVICSYNLKTKKFKKLSSKSRLFSPSLSEDGKKIVAAKVDLSNQFNLVELDATTGKILKTYSNPENEILQTPSFDKTGNRISYIGVSEKGKSLWLLESGKKTKLISGSRQQLNRPIFIGDKIVFNAHFNGIDNIYSIDIKSKKINALSASKYGAFNPTETSDKKIIFNDYKINGYEIAEKKITEKPVGQNVYIDFSTAAEKQENTGNVFTNIPDSTYQSKPYHQVLNLFSFHSIIPVIDNEYVFGLELQSNNLLNTMDFYTGAKYHRDLKRFEYTADISYKALYPVFSIAYRNRPKRTFYRAKNATQQGDWRENFIKLNASLPFSFNARNQNYSFSLNAATSFTQRYMLENLPGSFVTSLKFPMEYNLTFNHSVRTTERDIAPKWAQILRATYNHQPFDKNLGGKIIALESFFYFPGIAKNHSFLASFNYQKASGANQYAVEIPTVYGYNNILAKSKLQNSLLLNYRFPFAFPDWELGSLAYFRNFRAGLFSHYENIGKETNIGEPKTYGIELNSSLNILRYQPVVDVGARLVFVNKIYNQNPILEFSFNYSF